jgi:thioesterase domain-containing protein
MILMSDRKRAATVADKRPGLAVCAECRVEAVMDLETGLRALAACHQSMPPIVAMQARLAGYGDGRLRVAAPLAVNVNDKGCAFGGSLTALMTLAGWSLVTLRLWQAGVQADVFVADSQVRYLAPLYADLEAEAMAAEGESWDAFIATLRARGRARIGITALVQLPAGGMASDLQGRFVAKRKR